MWLQLSKKSVPPSPKKRKRKEKIKVHNNRNYVPIKFISTNLVCHWCCSTLPLGLYMLAYQLGQHMQLPTACDDVDYVKLLIPKLITKISVGLTLGAKCHQH